MIESTLEPLEATPSQVLPLSSLIILILMMLPDTIVSNIMLTDHIDVDINYILIQQILQLLLYLLHLLLVPQRLVDVHCPLQVYPRITDLQADVDRS